jgi:hypothetical protein
MNIDKIIFSIDDNPKYQGLWEINSQICKEHLGITPVLFHITDEDSDFYNDKWGVVKKIKALPNINNGSQSQIFRMFGTKYFQQETCLISDIDMLLFDKNYINSPLKNYDSNDLIIYCSDGYDVNREECYGIYGENRYPICYNLGTGEVFNKILNTNRSFEEYYIDIINSGYPLHDSDELYFGNKVNNFNHGVNIVKLRRGYSTYFKCPNRIDRINDDVFNVYDEELLKKGEYIDCHLSRPYIKYKKEINNMKDIILGNKKKEIYVIGCHIENERQLNMVKTLTDELYLNSKDFILTSHTMIPEDIIKKSKGFIYDSENPKYKIWDLPGKTKYVVDVGNFSIVSPYIAYGRVDYYHVGPLRQIVNAINLVRTMDYDIIHWMDYDATLDFDEEKLNVKRLTSCDMVFYGVGPKFSFKVDKVNEKILTMKNDEFLDLLSKHDYVIEKVFGEYLIDGNVLFIEVTDPVFWGKYSQNFDEIKFDWSLFELDGNVNLFVKNSDDKNINFNLEIDGNIINIISEPNIWFWRPIGIINGIGKLKISFSYDNDEKIIIIDENLYDPKKYESIVKSVNFIGK